MKQIVFVVGMHRSATSALTGCLVQLGYPLPQTPMARSEYNPKGHFESVAIMTVHDRILAQLGRSWSSAHPLDLTLLPDYERVIRDLEDILRAEFPDQDRIALKDPRSSLLLPLWQEACTRQGLAPRAIVMCRHPEEVAQSLYSRNQMPLEQGYRLWSLYSLAAELHTRTMPRLRVNSREFIENPEKVLTEVTRFLGDNQAQQALLNGALDGFVQSDLFKSFDISDTPERALADQILAGLQKIGRPGQKDTDTDLAHMDTLYQALNALPG